MPRFELVVNGVRRQVNVPADTPLLWVLRDHLSLTGTKYGCGLGVCGACTVHEGERAVRSCQVSIAQANAKSFTTIEGLSRNGDHPCHVAWLEEDVAQCGFCQPGMIMTAAGVLLRNPRATAEELQAALSECVCRCGTYQRIRKAAQRLVKGA